jgi:phosphotriesterase-related protein
MIDRKTVVTVRGEIESVDLGRTLIHEHLLVDFIGAKGITRDRYNSDDVVKVMLPYLEEIRRQGFKTFVECTPAYIGRDPALWKRISEESGLHIVTNTGLYAAGQREGAPEPYLPQYAYDLSADELAGGWLKEWFEGIEGTGIRPGFLKIGVNPGELRPISEKVVRAAAIVCGHTDLAIACHTGRGLSALRILDILEETSVAPDRYIFVHAQSEANKELHVECAKRGAWIEYDGVSPKSAEKHKELVVHLLERGFGDQILISQDAGWYRPGEPGGGKVRGFGFLQEQFLPMLWEAGVSKDTTDKLLVENPRRALEV